MHIMSVFKHVYSYLYLSMYAHVCIYEYVPVPVFECVLVLVFEHVCTCLYLLICTRTCIWACIHMFVSKQAYSCLYFSNVFRWLYLSTHTHIRICACTFCQYLFICKPMHIFGHVYIRLYLRMYVDVSPRNTNMQKKKLETSTESSFQATSLAVSVYYWSFLISEATHAMLCMR
jgi:hypothetical protein